MSLRLPPVRQDQNRVLLENLISLHANNKGADRLAHSHNLISVFVTRSLESRIVKLAPCKISISQLMMVALADWFEPYLTANPEDSFSPHVIEFNKSIRLNKK